jgi:hypothetical protein
MEFAPLAGDASSRRYYRIRLAGAGAPSSAVLMALAGSPLPLSSEELALFEAPPRELPFVNVHRFLAKIGVRVPALYGYWADEGILLLEDLGDRCLWDHARELPAGEISRWYRKAIDSLVLIQVEGARRRDDSCIAFQQRFDFRLYMWELDHFIEYGIEKSGGETGHIKPLRDELAAIAEELAARPPCLSHRDFHSWNLMIAGHDLAVIDFQDALLAPQQYDLASLLNDRETDRLITAELETELIAYYRERWREKTKTALDPEEFMDIYRLSAIQRDLKVVGRFYYLDLVKGKPGYLRYIPPTLRRLRRNLERLPRCRKIISLLAARFAEMQ